MATNPGLFTQWPWQKLGNFKYLLLAPMAAQTAYHLSETRLEEVDSSNVLILPMHLLRAIHGQLWISWARFQTARSKHRIVHKSLDFDQVDRERNWDDQLLLTTILFYLANMFIPGASFMPVWSTKGAVLTVLLHAGPVEFLYYWFHRALHHHYLYTRYHSHHHASIVTEPITSVIHPFIEEFVYFLLFAIPLLGTVLVGCGSVITLTGYIMYIDFMNYMGHCNFELVPQWFFRVFPPLKYLMYTPTFHALHHTQFRTNYSLFMPLYDYLYGTTDRASDELYERSLRGKEETPDVVHLSHPTSLLSVYQLRLGFASIASKPSGSRWYDILIWPLAFLSLIFARICTSAIVVERNKLKSLSLQTWVIPRFSFQYTLSWERNVINDLIEQTILDADSRGVKVLSLGLLNQGEELNNFGELYLQKHPKLSLKIVDGGALAAAATLHTIPSGAEEVLLRGKLTKVAFLVATALCQRSVKVITVKRDEFELLKLRLPSSLSSNLVLSKSYDAKVWLVGDEVTEKEQRRAVKGTIFIPFSQFPVYETRGDCYYSGPPAMTVPKTLENMHSCENWFPRRVMSACRVAGIVRGLEGGEERETGDAAFDVERAWQAALTHGFLPVPSPLASNK
ncbi:very-long-chain aldehyde decarbonylase GL1-4-like [Wolffia australiana]